MKKWSDFIEITARNINWDDPEQFKRAKRHAQTVADEANREDAPPAPQPTPTPPPQPAPDPTSSSGGSPPPAASFPPGSPAPSGGSGMSNMTNMLYSDPYKSVNNYLHGHPEFQILSDTPTGIWLGEWSGDIRKTVQEHCDRAKSQGKTPVFITYNIPNRDLGSHSAGGASGLVAYKDWVDELSLGVTTPCIFVVEPDTVSQDLTRERIEALQYEVRTLKATGSKVYIDAGHSAWHPVDEITKRLSQVIQYADGFALNVSNYRPLPELIKYGDEITKNIGKTYVIDTSRNGANIPPEPGEWCNPKGQEIGQLPTDETHSLYCDYYLWLKLPGESDGQCNGGPPAGQFWVEMAQELVSK